MRAAGCNATLEEHACGADRSRPVLARLLQYICSGKTLVVRLERALIAERTKVGLSAARAQGRVGGYPGVRAGDPATIRTIRANRDAKHLDGGLAPLDPWLPTVRRMRPDQSWGDFVRVLNRGQDATWMVERLHRTVNRLV